MLMGLVVLLAAAAPARAGGEAVLLAHQGEAAVMIRPDAGFKTYWRVPGETGVAPRFDWAGSENVKSVRVLYPAPRRYADAEGETIGYAGPVVFPLAVEAADAARPVRLKLQLDYAVCKDICIPAHAAMAAELSRMDAQAGALIARARENLPKPGTGAQARALLQGLEVRLAGIPAEDIFAEGVPLAYFRAPRPAGAGAYLLAVEGVAPETLKGKKLILTVISGKASYELTVTVQ